MLHHQDVTDDASVDFVSPDHDAGRSKRNKVIVKWTDPYNPLLQDFCKLSWREGDLEVGGYDNQHQNWGAVHGD